MYSPPPVSSPAGGRIGGVEVSAIRPSRRRRSLEVRALLRRTGFGNANHAVARDQPRELSFAHMFGAGWTLGDDQVAHVGTAVIDPHLDIEFQLQAKLLQHTTWIDDRPRAVAQTLVPVRWQAKQRPWIAGTERAHHPLMHLR